MHLAWFRSQTLNPADPLDAIAQLIDALRAHHAVEIIDESRAHDIVWRQHRDPFDVCVYELDDSPGSRFMSPYLLRYPGLTLLLSSTLTANWAWALQEAGRVQDLGSDHTFARRGLRPMLRVPLLASRLVGVPHRALAATLAYEVPEAHIETFAPGLRALPPTTLTIVGAVPDVVTFGSIAPDARQRARIERAAQRARDAGTRVNLLLDADARRVLRESHVLLALHWPMHGRLLSDAVAAMATGLVPIVLETLETSDWPSLDPHTWTPRNRIGSEAPACITLDVLDEEHSLMLAMRRLAVDAPLRARLGAAAHERWRNHLTLERAVESVERLLEHARSSAPPERPPDWPSHIAGDATETARGILREFGLTVDLLETT